jgi:two-component system alkaline phosphatase synthesis response regulator PhoP
MTDTTQQHILVAEDNAALASVIRFNLVRAGFQVTIANDGRQAWEFVQANRYDMLVTDQQMPEMTGCELCEKLRSVPEYAELPVIMLTAKGLELELPRLRDELKIMATFMKPFSPKEVVKAVEDCLAATH